VHFEYLGRVATLEELRRNAAREGRTFAAVMRAVPELAKLLGDFRESCLTPRTTWLGRVRAIAGIGRRARVTRRKAIRLCRSVETGLPAAQVERAVRDQVDAIRRAGEYAAYERAFALWHALHLPFCVGLFLAAAVHVGAVHMY
jgi:hypothetical protein